MCEKFLCFIVVVVVVLPFDYVIVAIAVYLLPPMPMLLGAPARVILGDALLFVGSFLGRRQQSAHTKVIIPSFELLPSVKLKLCEQQVQSLQVARY